MELDWPSWGGAERPRSVLLLEDGRGDATDRLCGELLAVDAPEPTRLLVVTLVDGPAARLAVWDAATDERPAETVAIGMADAADGGGGDGLDVRPITDPANLTRLGIEITEALADLDGDGPAVCFHSLSVLLQYAPVAQVARFLRVLTSHLDAAGANAHFHLDPGTQDERTVAALGSLFDEVVRAGGRDG